MGVIGAMIDSALSRVHVLPVEGANVRLLRIHLEAATVRRGWLIASTPADADVLIVCGDVTALQSEVDAVWAQLPWPSYRASVEDATQIDECLDGVVSGLRIARRLPRERPSSSAEVSAINCHANRPQTDEHPDPMQMQDSGARDGHRDHSQMGHGDDMDTPTGMDMDMGMAMSGPGGIALAAGSEDDRDGLEMDELHVCLGPILAHWPGGLMLRLTLHGDLVTAAEPEVLWDGSCHALTARERFASLSHAAADILALAGWPPIADRLLRLRDAALAGDDWTALSDASRRLGRRLRRAGMLAWTLPRSDTGGIDVYAALLKLLIDLGELADHPHDGVSGLASVSPDRLADAVVGHDLSTARLLIAALTARGVSAAAHKGHR